MAFNLKTSIGVAGFAFLLLFGASAYPFLDKSETFRTEVCSRLKDAKGCAASYRSHVGTYPEGTSETKEGVRLTLRDGTKRELVNKLTSSLDTLEHYSLLGFYPQHQYFLILKNLYGETSSFELVSYYTGEATALRGIPIFSPSGKEFIVVPQWHGSITTSVEVYKVDGETIEQTSAIELGSCPIVPSPRVCHNMSNALWLSDTDFVAFSVKYGKGGATVLGDFLVRATKHGNSWDLQNVPAN